MRKVTFNKNILLVVIFIFLLSTEASSQSKGTKSIDTTTVVHLAPGVTHPIAKNTQQPIGKKLSPTPYTFISGETRIFPSPNPQSEINISINKINPQVLLLSSQTFPVTNSWQGAYWSTNGGSTWIGSDNLPNNAPGRGDPSTAFDANGNGYIATMTPVTGNINADPIGYSVQRTTNNGTSWGAQVQATGNIIFDKEMIATDDVPTSPFVNNLYSAWMGSNGNNIIQFNRSIDQGTTFSAPITLSNHWGQGANVQTGLNGEVYVCWADYTNGNLPEQGLGFVRSLDGGQNFTASTIVVPYTGIRNAFGGQPEFGNTRVNSFPSMAVDKSNGSHTGRIYVAYAARENGNVNGRSIIQVIWSDNQGTNWSAPLTVSIPNGTESWFPWIAVDDKGLIYIVYYSFDQPTGFSTNTYVAMSNNGGSTFTNQIVSSVAHTTAPITEFSGGYAGDYIGITAYGWKAYPAWMDNRTGQWQDYVVKLDNTPSISGPAAFCNSASYTVTNLLPASTITWSVSPTGIINMPSTGNPVTATKISQGNVTLTATINGNPAETASLNISTIPQTSSIDYNMSGGCNNGIQTWYLNANPNMSGATNWLWTVDNPSSSGIYIYNPNSQNTFMDVSKGGGVSVTYTDACGETSQRNGVTIYSNCGYSYIVSPNPATSMVTVSAIPTNGRTVTTSSTISEINVYDFQNNLKRHQVLNKVSSTSIDVSNLPIGLYIVEISDGTYKERQKLQILR